MEPILTTADCAKALKVSKVAVQKQGAGGALVRIAVDGHTAFFTVKSLLEYATATNREVDKKAVTTLGKARLRELEAEAKANEAGKNLIAIRGEISAILAKLG